MRREPGRAEAMWLTADAEAPRAPAAAREPPLFALRALSRRNELDEKDFCVVFVFQHPQLLPHGVSSSSPILPVSAHHVQASGLHGQTWPVRVRACDKMAHVVDASTVSWRSCLLRHYEGCVAPVGVCFTLFFLVTWAQHRWKGLLHSGRDVCVLCGFTVGMSAALNPERRMVAATCSLP